MVTGLQELPGQADALWALQSVPDALHYHLTHLSIALLDLQRPKHAQAGFKLWQLDRLRYHHKCTKTAKTSGAVSEAHALHHQVFLISAGRFV